MQPVRQLFYTIFLNLPCLAASKISGFTSSGSETDNKTFAITVWANSADFVCLNQVLYHFQQSYSYITMASGCDRELNAATLKYHTLDI